MSHSLSNLVGVLDRLASILENCIPLNAKLAESDFDSVTGTNVLEVSVDSFAFPKSAVSWRQSVEVVCNRVKRSMGSLFSINIDDAFDSISIKNHNDSLSFHHGDDRRDIYAPGTQYTPSYASYQFMSDFAYHYRQIGNPESVEQIIKEFVEKSNRQNQALLDTRHPKDNSPER